MTQSERSRRTSVHLQLEVLEERTTPSTSTYVRGLYLNLLGRPAAADEVALWTDLINRGVPPGFVTQAISTSDEFLSNLIRLDYGTLLERPPSAFEVQAWLFQLRTGLTDRDFESAVLASAEYDVRHGGTNATWLASVYRDVLGREIDPLGQTVWGQQLQFGVRRFTVALQIVNSTEAHTRTVRTVYQQLLTREPDAGGRVFWVGRLSTGLSLPLFVAQVAASIEYIDRTSQGGLDPRLLAAASNGRAASVGVGIGAQQQPPPAQGAPSGSPGASGGGTLGSGSPVTSNPFPLLNLGGGTVTGANPFFDFLPFFSGTLPFTTFSTLAIPALGSNVFLGFVIGVTLPSQALPGAFGDLGGFGAPGSLSPRR